MPALERDESVAVSGVSVNGILISESCIARELQYHPASSLDSARTQATRALVIREVLLQEAARLNIHKPDHANTARNTETDEAHLIQSLLAREIKTPPVDEHSCRSYYRHHLQRFRTLPLYQAAHILFSASPADPAVREAVRQQATATLMTVQSDPEKFSALAKKYSACSSGQHGGSLGQIEAGQTVTEFEQQLAQMTVGEICPRLVETRFGFHIVRLDHRAEGRQLPFEAVREQIANYLEESVWRRAVNQYLHQLLNEAEIVGFEIETETSTPMQ